jgi:hypothetical protein
VETIVLAVAVATSTAPLTPLEQRLFLALSDCTAEVNVKPPDNTFRDVLIAAGASLIVGFAVGVSVGVLHASDQ